MVHLTLFFNYIFSFNCADRVNRVIKTIETLEIVAEKVKVIANDIAWELPDHGERKNVVLLIEKIAKDIVKDAHTMETIIGKVIIIIINFPSNLR